MRITLIGSGNIARWFAYSMTKSGDSIVQIYSHQLKNAELLAGKFGGKAIDNFENLQYDSDLYLFSVKDDFYIPLISGLKEKLSLAVHTAGSVSVNIFENYAHQYGVVYPYQTISKQTAYEQLKVPLCIEGNSPETEERLETIAQRWSDIIFRIHESQRFQLHLAAVFASNFSNAMYDIAYNLLQKHQIDWNIILPLLQNTLDKIKILSPSEAQTGPAFRNDSQTIQKQMDAIEDNELKKIYQVVTEYIINHQNKNPE